MPLPLVTPYLPHVLLAIAAALAVLRTPERLTAPAPQTSTPGASKDQIFTDTVLARVFVTFFLPFAPWVFGGAAVSLAYLIPIVAPKLGQFALVYCAVVAMAGAAAGIVAQPLAKAWHRPGTPRLVIGAMSLVIVGLAGGALAVAAESPLLVALDALILGLSFGVCQFCGLLTVQRVANPSSLATTVAGFQVLSYVGFALPFLMSLVEERWSIAPANVVLGVTALAVVCAALSASTKAARG
jgi:hypothetical protein